jgi:hypothetical protein
MEKKRPGIGDHFNGLASVMLELREPMFSGWWCNNHHEKYKSQWERLSI